MSRRVGALKIVLLSAFLIAPNCGGNAAKHAKTIAAREASTVDDVTRAARSYASQTGRSSDDVLRDWAQVQPQRPAGERFVAPIRTNPEVRSRTAVEEVLRESACDLVFDALNSGVLPSPRDVATTVTENAAQRSLSRSDIQATLSDLEDFFEETQSMPPTVARARLFLLQQKHC